MIVIFTTVVPPTSSQPTSSESPTLSPSASPTAQTVKPTISNVSTDGFFMILLIYSSKFQITDQFLAMMFGRTQQARLMVSILHITCRNFCIYSIKLKFPFLLTNTIVIFTTVTPPTSDEPTTSAPPTQSPMSIQNNFPSLSPSTSPTSPTVQPTLSNVSDRFSRFKNISRFVESSTVWNDILLKWLAGPS